PMKISGESKLVGDHERLDGGDDAFRDIRVLEPPQELIHSASADRFDTDINHRRLGNQTDEVRLLVVARDELDLARADLDAVLKEGWLDHRHLHVVGDEDSGGSGGEREVLADEGFD